MRHKPDSNFPIVGIGASAGGYEAIKELLKQLPADTGMAFVIVQHLDPTHESALSELFSRATNMPVIQAKNNLRVESNQIYIIPPNKLMQLESRKLKISPRYDGKVGRLPVDYFFRSLAESESERAIGIVLSGNGSDGTLGLLAIKSAGGITFAQEEKSAKFASMPASAVAAGCVDFVLTPEKMASKMKLIGERLMHLPLQETEAEEDEDHAKHDKAFGEILTFLRHRMAVDFTHYKHATLRRRMRIRAYKTMEKKIDGVIALVDIDMIRSDADRLRQSHATVETLIDAMPAPLLVVDDKLTVTMANPVFYQIFKKGRDETVGRHIYELSEGQWHALKLRSMQECVLNDKKTVDDFEIEHDFPACGKRKLGITARPLAVDDSAMILLSMEEK